MQTLAEIGFVLGLILPPLAVVVGAGVTLGSSLVDWRSRTATPANLQRVDPPAVRHAVKGRA